MDELLKKLSSYNLLNYLLPGVAFVVLAKEVCGYSLYIDNIVLGAFYYYFIGLIIGRIGSLIIEPLCRRIGIVKFRNYVRYVRASVKDTKLETLSETNNTYRTFIAVMLCLGLLRLVLWIIALVPILKNYVAPILIVAFLVLLLQSYRKQSSYICDRIDISEKTDGGAVGAPQE